jgi:hypothetical protein
MTGEELEALEEDSDFDWEEDSVVSDFGSLEAEPLEVEHRRQDFVLETPWSAGCGPAWSWPVAHLAAASCTEDDEDDDYNSGASTACPTPPLMTKSRKLAHASATRWADLSDSEDEAAEPGCCSCADLAEATDVTWSVEPPQRLRWADLADLEDLEGEAF